MCEEDISLLNEIKDVLHPINIAPKRLCADHVTIDDSERIIKFALSKLGAIGSELADKLKSKLHERTSHRQNEFLVNLFQWLQSPTPLDPEMEETMIALCERLFPNCNSIPKSINETSNETGNETFEEELEKMIKNKKRKAEKITIKEAIDAYSISRVMPQELHKLQEALESVQATSVLSERVFSLCGNFLTAKRNRMSGSLLHSLILLKYLK